MAENLLITGETGTLNVTSEAAGAFHAAIVGSGQYVLTGCDISLQDATTVRITNGVICMNGREVYIPSSGATVNIDPGSAGVNRNDFIVVRYQKQSSGDGRVESATIEYIKGTPAATAKDPSYNAGSILNNSVIVDMLLARVKFNGVTPTIESLASKVGSLSSQPQSGLEQLNKDKPVGSLYFAWVSTSPALLFGGTWTQISGRVIRAANDVGAGGSDTHYHWETIGSSSSADSVLYVTSPYSDTAGLGVPDTRITTVRRKAVDFDITDNGSYPSRQTSTYTASSLPAYQNVYCWRRTA